MSAKVIPHLPALEITDIKSECFLLPAVMDSWSTHTKEKSLFSVFSSIKLNLLIFVKLLDQTSYALFTKKGFG